MRTIISLSLIVTLLFISNVRAATKQDPQPQTQATVIEKPKPNVTTLLEDTPVSLRLTQNLTSASAKLNDKVDFEVIDPIKIGDTVIIEQGATAIATVTRATPKKVFGRAGKLDVNIDYVRLVNNDKVSLRAVKGGSGGSRTGVMTTAVVATAIVFFPAAPLFFFIKGKNIEIPKGTEITSYVAADTAVNLPTHPTTSETVTAANAETGAAAVVLTSQSEASNAAVATLLIKSDPVGAEISVDEKFMGTTQSTLKLSPGEHTIVITKAGYKEWKRTITLNPASDITVDASLEMVPLE